MSTKRIWRWEVDRYMAAGWTIWWDSWLRPTACCDDGLDRAIDDELKHAPGAIMTTEKGG